MDTGEKFGVGIVGTIALGLASIITYIIGWNQGSEYNRPDSVYQADVDSDGCRISL